MRVHDIMELGGALNQARVLTVISKGRRKQIRIVLPGVTSGCILRFRPEWLGAVLNAKSRTLEMESLGEVAHEWRRHC